MAAVSEAFQDFLGAVSDNILNPFIYLLIAVAFFVFVWGIFEYIIHADEPTKRSDGGKHMIYGLLGMLIMFSAFGIINLIGNTVDNFFGP